MPYGGRRVPSAFDLVSAEFLHRECGCAAAMLLIPAKGPRTTQGPLLVVMRSKQSQSRERVLRLLAFVVGLVERQIGWE